MELITSLLCLALSSSTADCPDNSAQTKPAAAETSTAEAAPVVPEALGQPSAVEPPPTESTAIEAQSAETLTAESGPTKPKLTSTVYVDTRMPFQHDRAISLSPLAAPTVSNLSEGNVQLKATLTPHTFAMGDASLYWQWADLIKNGQAFESTQYRPQVIVNELYVSSEQNEHLNLTLGKKRVVWGPGMAWNPMDFLNPPKDPSNPTAQRAGAWLGRVEMPYDKFTLSFVGAAQVLRQYSGLPTALVYSPDYVTAEQQAATGKAAVDHPDPQPHFAAAVRAYALVADTDVNVVYGYTNEFNDAFQHKNRLGFSLSHAFGAWELHTETLLQTGYSRIWPNANCVNSAENPSAFGDCVAAQTPLAPRSMSMLDSNAFTPKALLGARYQFEDNAIFSAEYFFNGEGLDAKGYANYVRMLSDGLRMATDPKTDPKTVANLQSQLAGVSADPGSPQRFNFDPLRRHYLFLSYSRPQLWNDFTLGASVMASLSDFSGQVAPFVTWAPQEWLELNTTAYIGVPSIGNGAVEVNGHRYGEFMLAPSDLSVQVSARAYF
jgi:hypothetical protein